jgi:hypothetical protein
MNMSEEDMTEQLAIMESIRQFEEEEQLRNAIEASLQISKVAAVKPKISSSLPKPQSKPQSQSKPKSQSQSKIKILETLKDDSEEEEDESVEDESTESIIEEKQNSNVVDKEYNKIIKKLSKIKSSK